MEAMKGKLVGDIKVSPSLVRRFYESLPKDSLPFIQEQVEVQVITLEPEIDIEEIERVKGELRDYTERITSGETSFSTMALLYSQDPGSARRLSASTSKTSARSSRLYGTDSASS